MQAATAWETMESDTGIFKDGQNVDWITVMQAAQRLSWQYTPRCNARSLDILHVAVALNLGSTDFISFDKRQRQIASLAGLNVLPLAVPVD